jgi:hypothetical protein
MLIMSAVRLVPINRSPSVADDSAEEEGGICDEGSSPDEGSFLLGGD